MTIDKVKYQTVLDEAAVTEAAMIVLENAAYEADANHPFEADFTSVHATIEEVRIWATDKILEADQEQVMASFLSEMKLVFEKYSAILEVGSSTDGYGLDYGNSVANAGVKFTATLEGIMAVKEIGKVVIVSGDLV